MTLIRQPEAKGCGVACIAMVAGIGYNEAALMFGRRFETNGVHHQQLLYALGVLGYACITAYSFGFGGIPVAPWPPVPFAPAHIVSVTQPSNNTHFVVMRADGVILDPLRDGEHNISEWKDVQRVDGFWRV